MLPVTKILMVMDAMFANPDKEWVVWSDDDVVINTGVGEILCPSFD